MTEATDRQRLDQLLNALVEMISGNFSVRLPVAAVEDVWDGIHSAINITAEELGRRAEAHYELSRHLRAVFDAMPDAAIVLSPEGNIRALNPTAARLLEQSAAHLIGRPVRLIFDDEATVGRLCELTSGQGQARFETRLRNARGAGFPVLLYARAAGEPGPQQELVLVVRDLTEERRAQAALRWSEQRFRSIFEQGSVGMTICDGEGRLVKTNAAFQRLLGYSEEELGGVHLRDLLHPDDRPLLDARIAHKVLGPLPESEKRYLHRDGRGIPVRVSPAWMHDPELGWYGASVIADITEQRRMEELRRQVTQSVVMAQEEERGRVAQELHDALGQLLTSLAVQIRSVEELSHERGIRQRLSKVRGLAEAIIGEVSRLAYALRPPALDDLGLAAALEELATDTTQVHGIAVDLHVRGGATEVRLPAAAEAALYRIVQESLTNVAKHAGASSASITLEVTTASARLIVEDDGRGFHLDSQTGLAKASRGLGLAGIRERARLLGGQATFESRPGKGSAVYVTLPMMEHSA